MTAQPVDTTPPTPTALDPVRGSVPEAAPPASWHALDEPAAVRFLPSGTPLALRWRGSIWQVIGAPTQWSISDSRQERGTTALGNPHGSHLGRHDGQGSRGSTGMTRFWRFQAQTGPASPVLEFDMSADPRRPDWRLRRVTTVDGY